MTGVDASTRGVDGGASNKPLRILAVHRYYWPDSPAYGVILQRIVNRWTRDGHHVDVLTGRPSYRENTASIDWSPHEVVNGVNVRRLSLPAEAGRPVVRIVNALRLSWALFTKALRGRYDVIMIATSPPVIGGAVAAAVARFSGARFIYNCMDIHPEVGAISGEFSNPVVSKLLTWLDSFSCRMANPVVVLSKDMANTLRERKHCGRVPIRVLNNFSLPTDQPIPEQLPFELYPERFTVLFAGNIGRFQGLESAVDAMVKLNHRDDIELVLMGDGVARAALEKKANETSAKIRFVGHHPVEVAKAAMRQADVGFVSLVSDLYRYAYPSKTMTYLEQGCPLVIGVEPESQLAQDAAAEGYGYCVPVGDDDALAQLIEYLADSPTECKQMREAALRKAQSDFLESVVLDRWSALLVEKVV